MPIRRRRKKKPSPEKKEVCSASGCDADPTNMEYGFCYHHWISVPVPLRKPLWGSEPGTPQRYKAVEAVKRWLLDWGL